MDFRTALAKLTTWFENYVKGFESSDPDSLENVNLKRDHTSRVRDAILEIGKSIGLNEEDMRIAEACALLHDIGRFEQHRKYGTFSDSISVNHAALGVRIIREHDVLKNFSSASKKIIIRSVGCHNMARIPEKNNREWILFLKLVRDADKIDILNIITEYYKNSVSGKNRALELHLPDTNTISDAVYTPLSKGNIALVENLCSLNGFKLYQMGWVYDLNFIRSLEIFREREYLKLIRNALPESSRKADEIFKITNEYLTLKTEHSPIIHRTSFS